MQVERWTDGRGRRRRRMLCFASTLTTLSTVPDVTLQAEHGGARPHMKLPLESRRRVADSLGLGSVRGGEVWLGTSWRGERDSHCRLLLESDGGAISPRSSRRAAFAPPPLPHPVHHYLYYHDHILAFRPPTPNGLPTPIASPLERVAAPS
jgi:hypothetical protein